MSTSAPSQPSQRYAPTDEEKRISRELLKEARQIWTDILKRTEQKYRKGEYRDAAAAMAILGGTARDVIIGRHHITGLSVTRRLISDQLREAGQPGQESPAQPETRPAPDHKRRHMPRISLKTLEERSKRRATE